MLEDSESGVCRSQIPVICSFVTSSGVDFSDDDFSADTSDHKEVVELLGCGDSTFDDTSLEVVS